MAATEPWPPNVESARRNLRTVGASVVKVADDAPLPFPDASFNLVVSRHPVVTRWDEVGRVLRPGGAYLSQQVGAGSVREPHHFLRRCSGPTVRTCGADGAALRLRPGDFGR
ncbi:methyltransferase domain-containing protein [Actinosynnema sp. CS-041913]|uniref:methyltransferase domain-containing protein n=1 Tax=Actinosynnema sp. CS-041913 TaxID=3239917 RepID=UPI003D89E744